MRASVRVDHDVETDPWLHHVPFLGIKVAAIDLTLTGSAFASYMRTSASPSPHWNVPRSLPPFYTPFTTVALSSFHAFSFNALIKLLQHFKRSRTIHVKHVNWEPPAAQAIGPVRHRNPGRNSFGTGPLCVTATECTDCVSICLQTSLLYPDLPLCAVSVAERNAVAQLLASVPDLDYQVTNTVMNWDGIDDTVRFTIIEFGEPKHIVSFTCPHEATAANGSRDRRVNAMSLRVLERTWDADTYIKFAADLHHFPFLLNVVVSFSYFGVMRNDFFQRREIGGLILPEHVAFSVACPREQPQSSETAWELYNAATLQPIGLCANHDSIVPWLLKRQDILTVNAPGLSYADGVPMDAITISKTLKPWNPFCFFSLDPGGMMEFGVKSTITFENDGERYGHGINLKDVLEERKLVVLHGENGFPNADKFIKIRTNWPGYSKHTAYIPVNQWPISASDPEQTLAACVAHAVRLFYQTAIPLSESGALGEEDAENHWSLENVPYHYLRLLDIHRVSADLWQPVLISVRF
ncbi:hypothetical protein BC835DRAFT_1416623 [Cytidiella melzeri]|nr:hypothetical protein BC835DRAFT_1416623 [Cytidiella melzeri]